MHIKNQMITRYKILSAISFHSQYLFVKQNTCFVSLYNCYPSCRRKETEASQNTMTELTNPENLEEDCTQMFSGG